VDRRSTFRRGAVPAMVYALAQKPPPAEGVPRASGGVYHGRVAAVRVAATGRGETFLDGLGLLVGTDAIVSAQAGVVAVR
jgi:hypothetical protein